VLLSLLDGHFNAIFFSLLAGAAYFVYSSRRRFPDCDKAHLWDFASGIGDFLHENASRLLVLAVFAVLLAFAYHAAGDPNKGKFAEFCQSKAGEAFAAFLSLIVASRMTGTNGNTPHT
jgi:hypothetical protein